MTEEKKTTTTKTPTKKEAPKKPVKKEKIAPDAEILVYNNTTGSLKYSARKGNGYLEFSDFMDSDYLTFEELQQMRNSPHKKMLESGWIFVDDEDALEQLNLGKLKDKVKSPELLQKLVEDGNSTKILEVAEKLGADSKMVLYDIIKKGYEAQTFSNAHTIKEIETMLKVKDPIIQG